MFSALAFSWEINQSRVNKLVTTPVLLQDGCGLANTANFSDFQIALLTGASLRQERPWGVGMEWDSTQ